MSNLRVLPVKKLKNTKPRKQIAKGLPIPPFCWNLLAPVRSGKSNFACNILFNSRWGYDEFFDKKYYISPTVLNCKTCWAIREDPEITLITDNLDELDEILQAIVEEQKEEDPDDLPHTLVVLDDCLGYLNKGHDNLCSRFRHLNLSIITMSQQFRKFGVVNRANSDYWNIWKMNSNKELMKMDEEFENIFKGFRKYYEIATKKKYDFLFVDMKEMELKHNFGKILFKQDQSEEQTTTPTEVDNDSG